MRRSEIGLVASLAAIGTIMFGSLAPSSRAGEFPEARQSRNRTFGSPHGFASPQSPGVAGSDGDERLNPPVVQAILDRRQARQASCEHTRWPRWCHYCAQAEAALRLAPLTLRPFTSEVGLFVLDQPYQYRPSPYAYAAATPAFPPKPLLGASDQLPGPWRLPTFESDFRYLDNPASRTVDPVDLIKRVPAPIESIVSDFGGEFRWQGRIEQNRRLLGAQNDHNLFRERLYLDTWYWDRFRTFFEVLWADSTRQEVPPIFFDLNHGDFLNAFGEFRFFDRDDRTFSGRFGDRQQLLFGNQRLISPLDWANSPRTFKHVANGLWRSPNWNLDLFWLRPNVILPNDFDQANEFQQFFGSYLVYKGIENQLYDFYYLGFLQEDAPGVTFNGEAGNLAIHTLGTRYQGEFEGYLWEGELAYQFGEHRGLPRNAGTVATGFGRRFSRLPLKPDLMIYFDYASGNRFPGASDFATFNQLFPFGHKYLGYMDIIGRQNIISPNAFVRFNFGPRAHLVLWYHHFQLASARDALYNAAGTPVRFDPTGAAGRYVGDELDLLLIMYLNPHTDLHLGVSQFWSGSFVEQTAPDPAAGGDAFFFYTQFTFRF